MFGPLYLAIKVLVSGLSEIDITMLAEKLSAERKRNVKVEKHGQFSVEFTREKLELRCPVRAPLFRGLTDSEYQQLASAVQLLSCSNCEMIFFQDDLL